MSRIELADALEIARIIAAEAARLLEGAAGSARQVTTKSTPQDLVTEWDTRIEDLIHERLDALAPGIPVLGEERGSGDASGGAGGEGADAENRTGDQWLVDPIDGTVNFAHGLPIFSVCISLERERRPVVGVVRAPALGWEFHARAGNGAFEGDERLRVSGIAALSRAMLATGFPYDRATSPQNNFADWEHFQRRAGACRRLGSAALDLCMVARGWYDGYWESKLSPWDVSAGALMVVEAGGKVTSTDGSPFLSHSGNAVASNGAIHKEILDELAAVSRDPRSRR